MKIVRTQRLLKSTGNSAQTFWLPKAVADYAAREHFVRAAVEVCAIATEGDQRPPAAPSAKTITSLPMAALRKIPEAYILELGG